MPIYSYTARDASAEVIIGEILAESTASAAACIRKKGLYVTSIKPKRQSFKFIVDKKLHAVSCKDFAVFCSEFSTLINAGVTVTSSMQIMITQTQSLLLKACLEEIYQKVQAGKSLTEAMRCFPDTFSNFMTSMIEAGEVGGVLDKVLSELAVHYEKEHDLNMRIKSALIYPSLVLLLGCLMFLFIINYVLPAFIDFYQLLGVELPVLTQCLLTFTAFITHSGVYLFLVVCLAGVIYYGHYKPEGHMLLDKKLLGVPVFGPMRQKVIVARFSRTLSTLVHGGVPILTAVDIVKKLTNNLLLIKTISEVQRGLKEGDSLSEHLSVSSAFPTMAVQMIRVGEETGELDGMLAKVADFYEKDVDNMILKLNSMLEPVLITIAAFVIGIIIFAIVLPMFQVVSSVSETF